MQSDMQDKEVTMRANYRRPIVVTGILTVVAVLLLLSGTLPEPYMWLTIWALIVLAVLLLTMIIASLLSFIRLTAEGFSEPIHILRVFNRWSEVSSFHVVDKRVLGVRIRGVGFNYVRPYRVREKRRRRFDYDRVIDASYGEPAMLVHVLNAWREEWINRNARNETQQTLRNRPGR